ncbi:Unknown protein [Striga hermonthica]|uniref:Uncharacterized protein n=1 Tax=Striga hermonthica TaxID=68872 RepID=A0A9N7NCL6_STRHE|nr:Unknown protein [Striga hermonthica]
MGVPFLDIGITKLKKGAIFTIRGCFRSACNHPLLVCNLCFLIFLHRVFPFVFSLLVTASPVLICTAILLGAFLSFGQPNLPDFEKHEKTVPVENEVSRDVVLVEQNETGYCADKRDDGIDRMSTIEISRECNGSNVEEKIESCNDEIWEDTLDEAKGDECDEERLGEEGKLVEENRYLSTPKDNGRNGKSDDEGSFDSEAADLGSPNSPHSSWKRVGNDVDDDGVDDDDVDGDGMDDDDVDDDGVDDDDVDDDGVDDDDVDSGSGGSVTSSPDPSVASDMMPMLDELHPLLDEDSSNQILVSQNVSSLASEQSSSSSRSSMSSIDSIDKIEEFEEDKDEEQSKSAITWTEEDQKNLMDLGSSEIERNQRLENLILRRRRKNVSMVPEINLIDLEGSGSDFPPPPPVSTARKNPFDLPNDENAPGSAPSVLVQRRNPFEFVFPYETGLERGVGSYFVVPETGFAPFGRQSSRDSKTSSAPDTESVKSVKSSGSLEDQLKLPEESSEEEDSIDEPPRLISDMNHVSEHIGHGSQSSDDEDEGLSDSDREKKLVADESNGSCSESENEGPTRVSPESGETSIMGVLADENPHREPVYDSSPHSIRKNMSSCSVSSDVNAEPGGASLAPVVVKRTVSFLEEENRADERGDGASKMEIHMSNSNNNSCGKLDEEKRLKIDEGEKVESPDSGGDYQEASEKLVSTPSAGGSTTLSNYISMHDRNFDHPEEVPVPNTPVESNEIVRTIQNLNIPEIYELDHETSPSLGSPYSPDFISMPSSAGSHVNMQTIQEETDDGGLLSELDSVGDFSVTSGSDSNESEKQIDYEEGGVNILRGARTSFQNDEFDEMDTQDDFTRVENKGCRDSSDDDDSLPNKGDDESKEIKARDVENLDEENEANNLVDSEVKEDHRVINISQENEPGVKLVGPTVDLPILDSVEKTREKLDSVDSRDEQETSDLRRVEEIIDPQSSSSPANKPLDENSEKVDSCSSAPRRSDRYFLIFAASPLSCHSPA